MVSFRCPLRIRIKGGKGSGHKGHRGRPGLQGGSLPGVGGARDVVADWSDVLDEDFKRVFGDKLTRESVEDMFILPGMTLEFHAEAGGPNDIEVVGEWRSSTGELAGRTTRIFIRDSEGRHAHNDKLEFESGFRDKGLATSLYDRQEAQLRKAGFKDITLHANITIGRYAWARRGYNYKEGLIEARAASDRFKLWCEKWAEIDKPATGWPKFKSASDVANYKIPGVSLRGEGIWNDDVPKSMEMHVGKAFMLDKSSYGHGSWDAVKMLQGE